MKDHRVLALLAWTLAWSLAVAGGSLFAHVERLSEGIGLYWAVTTVTSVGYGDVVPHTVAGHWIAVGTMLLAYTIWLIGFGLMTSWFMSLHINARHIDLKEFIERRIKHHLGIELDQVDESREE
ncbi:MAG: potassium channel family protein [Sulfobacillus sp.]